MSDRVGKYTTDLLRFLILNNLMECLITILKTEVVCRNTDIVYLIKNVQQLVQDLVIGILLAEIYWLKSQQSVVSTGRHNVPLSSRQIEYSTWTIWSRNRHREICLSWSFHILQVYATKPQTAVVFKANTAFHHIQRHLYERIMENFFKSKIGNVWNNTKQYYKNFNNLWNSIWDVWCDIPDLV